MENELFKYDNYTLIIKNGITIINEGPFENLNIKRLILSDSVTEIKPFAFYNNNIEEIIFNNNITKIGNCAFNKNKIKKLVLPNSLKEIGKQSFSNNEIEELVLSNNIKIIESKAFENNKINKVITSAIEIKDDAFKNNNIKELNLGNEIIKIGKGAFSKNRFEYLILPDTITKIDEDAFMQSGIKYLKLPKNLEVISDNTFKYNAIEKLVLNNNLKEINSHAFEENKIKELIINDNLKSINDYAFSKNELKMLNLNNVKKIGNYSFSNNEIEVLNDMNKLEIIGNEAFFNNKIKEIIIPNNVKEIGNGAFYGNKINKITLPNCKIGKNAFYSNITYVNGLLYDNKLLSKFETQNINKILMINKLFSNYNFDIIDKYDLEKIELSKEVLNGYHCNYKTYNKLFEYASHTYKLYSITNKESKLYNAFFNLCLHSGLFNTGGHDLNITVDIIEKFISYIDAESLIKMFNNITNNKYDPKYRKILNEFINNNENRFFIDVMNNVCNNFPDLKKIITKQKKYEISKINTEYKKTHNNDLLELMNQKKKDVNNITLNDIKSYYSNNVFEVRENLSYLKEVILLLSCFINQDDFNKLQDIYELYNNDIEYKYFKDVIDNDKDKYNYKWIRGNNPYNSILGYLVNSCSTISRQGEDIMRQTILNPKVKNLVIYKGSEIIGKLTSYYNPDLKYILCNTVMLTKKFKSSSKTTEKDKEKVFNVILRGLMEQKNEMERNNIQVNEIRIGMHGNDLASELKKLEIIKDDLLENYNYLNHMGDANFKTFGQALIYRK